MFQQLKLKRDSWNGDQKGMYLQVIHTSRVDHFFLPAIKATYRQQVLGIKHEIDI